MTEHDDRDDVASTLLRGHLDPPDPRVRSRHIAAALDVYDELSSASSTGVVVRTHRWRRPVVAIASCAAAAIIVAGVTLLERDRPVTSGNVASAARNADTTVLGPQFGTAADATNDSSATKGAAAPSVTSRSADAGGGSPVTLGTFGDEAGLRAAVVALDRVPAAANQAEVPVTTSRPTPPSAETNATSPAGAPSPAPAAPSTMAPAFDATQLCATAAVAGGVELHRYLAVLRSVPVTVVVVRVAGNATPVIGVLEPPECHLREL